MPKTRPTVSKEQKTDDIVRAAERRLRDGGYEALSVAAIARELGLAQNALYWYFPSKDHLFVAALERMLREIAARKPARTQATTQRVLWFTDQFADLSVLRGAMSERARTSPVVAEFLTELDALIDRMLANALRDHVPPDELALAVDAFRATVEGTFARGLERRERRKLLQFSLARVMDR